MLLSFIVPVYNATSAFDECIASLRPLLEAGVAEAVAVDDGSEVPLRFDCVGLRIIRQQHRGAAAARNAGIAAAQGDFVWPVDADDVVLADGIQCLLDDLKSMPAEVPLFHIGAMVTQARRGERPAVASPDASLTRQCVPLSLLRPRTSITDHTTNIIRRSWLTEHPELRYADDMSLLEDTVFSLGVVEAAESCLCNDSYRFYCNRTYNVSSTAGAWAANRSRRFTADICRFFRFLRLFADRHSQSENVQQFYERYRYVYLRVMAVKGCPWSDISSLMDVVGRVRWYQLPLYRLFACLCRLLRSKR
ncbi:MAG: glycosyltransferase [Bacteroidales bacterium]|nr:glycosyltransferase [Bacteroidales bacterium]